jgi:hypothetical protein
VPSNFALDHGRRERNFWMQIRIVLEGLRGEENISELYCEPKGSDNVVRIRKR